MMNIPANSRAPRGGWLKRQFDRCLSLLTGNAGQAGAIDQCRKSAAPNEQSNLDEVSQAQPVPDRAPSVPQPAARASCAPRNRTTRFFTHITYEAKRDGVVREFEMPFVVGVLGNFSGHSNRGRLRDRMFHLIGRDNFDDVLRRIAPQLQLRISPVVSAVEREQRLELCFESLDDFGPSGVARQIEPFLAPLKGGRKLLNRHIAAVLHHPDFMKLESTWRGLYFLCTQNENSSPVRIKILDCTKNEFAIELDSPPEVEQSTLYRRIVNDPWQCDLVEPFSVLIADYQFSHHPVDVTLLTHMATLGAAACCPFLAAASPELLGLERWSDLNKPPDLTSIVESSSHAAWNRFRDSEDARYVVLTGPRTLARLPYTGYRREKAEFQFNELAFDIDFDFGESIPELNTRLCWMNTAFVLVTQMTNAFRHFGICLYLSANVAHEDRDSQRPNGDGLFGGIPSSVDLAGIADQQAFAPSEFSMNDRREREFRDCGLVALSPSRYGATFLSMPTCHRSKQHDCADASANACIATDLSYVMVESRFAHYVKAVYGTLQKIPKEDIAQEAQSMWISGYVKSCGSTSDHTHTELPLADARIDIQNHPDLPGARLAVMHLHPWLDHGFPTNALRRVFSL